MKLSKGTSVDIEALNQNIQILYVSSNKLSEPVACGGPIVMNTKEELDLAFRELISRTFLKKSQLLNEKEILF